MKLIIIIFTILLLLALWDLYPTLNDIGLRYLLGKSYLQTNGSLNAHFKNLDTIIENSHDFEGHTACCKSKIKFINEVLQKYRPKRVCEIGFNGGHSASIFLSDKNVKHLHSFDLCDHKYSQKSIEYIKKNFKNRFSLTCGDSTKTVPKYNGQKFDLVFIDGGHYNDIPNQDIINTLAHLANPGALIMMDDTHYSYLISFFTNHSVDKYWNRAINYKMIKPIKTIPGLSLGMATGK